MISTSALRNHSRIDAKTESALDRLIAEVGIKRITNQILLHWGTREGDVFMNSLLINDREQQRAGFPPHVSKAIFALIKLNEVEMRREVVAPVANPVVEPH
ncbi:MAG: hypothetical protein H7232_07325 [Aeromicrobium sp.]|nr:hypothetical protein [Burkholderiales bacterium]